MERVIRKRLYDFLDKHNILYNSQYGFRRKHSTTDAVAKFVKGGLLAYERNEHTTAIFQIVRYNKS